MFVYCASPFFAEDDRVPQVVLLSSLDLLFPRKDKKYTDTTARTRYLPSAVPRSVIMGRHQERLVVVLSVVLLILSHNATQELPKLCEHEVFLIDGGLDTALRNARV